ncbi:MAG: O-acetyl-ADP-ribose deacetylase [Dokdonella sp.]
MISIIKADITTLSVDAIVNAANETLLGGGGVDGAIHRAAGSQLLAACRALPKVGLGVRCPTGEARITAGFDLPARFVIHTVGPVWAGGTAGEAELLADCYRNVLSIAHKQSLNSIAFPAISCGVFGYPPNKAALVALGELSKNQHATLAITICCRGSEIIESYRSAAAHLGITPPD